MIKTWQPRCDQGFRANSTNRSPRQSYSTSPLPAGKSPTYGSLTEDLVMDTVELRSGGTIGEVAWAFCL